MSCLACSTGGRIAVTYLLDIIRYDTKGGRGSGGEAVVPADAAAEAQGSARQDRELCARCPGGLEVS